MIQTPTVFVVGAGASADYGLPLGPALVREIVGGLAPELNGVLGVALTAAGFRSKDLLSFAEHLSHSDLTSVDAFLENNSPEFIEIGTACIAAMILFREQTPKAKLFQSPPNDHWLKYVWNLMRAETDASTFGENRVAFVTFNYDRLIEYYFETVLAHAFSLAPQEARTILESVPIIHLHGKIEQREFGEFNHPLDSATTRAIADGIRIIHDPLPQDDPNFDRAYELFRESSTVCLLGLSYHPENIKRLQLSSLAPPNRVAVYGTAYDIGRAEMLVAQSRMGRPFIYGRNDEKVEKFLREQVRLE